MSNLHVEWEDHVRDLGVEILDHDEAIEDLQPDDGGDNLGPYVLILSSGGGGALATSGTREELMRLARKIFDQAKRLPRDISDRPI